MRIADTLSIDILNAHCGVRILSWRHACSRVVQVKTVSCHWPMRVREKRLVQNSLFVGKCQCRYLLANSLVFSIFVLRYSHSTELTGLWVNLVFDKVIGSMRASNACLLTVAHTTMTWWMTWVAVGEHMFDACVFVSSTSNQTWRPAEFKHITRRRKRN